MKSFVLAALLVLLPLSVSAAGFAKESLFLSKTPVTEGEVVLIHAVVANENATKFTGEVIFKDAGIKIGTVSVTIAAGGAQAVSVSWKPSAGSHTVVAALTQTDGTIVEQESAVFTIAEKPKPPTKPTIVATTSQPATTVESSQNIKNSIGQYSPALASTSAPVFSAIDSVRTSAADALDRGIAWAKAKTSGTSPTGGRGEVLGTSTEATAGGLIGTMWSVIGGIAVFVLSALRFIVGSAGIFYPVFAILFFFILWKTFKRFRRPSYA